MSVRETVEWSALRRLDAPAWAGWRQEPPVTIVTGWSGRRGRVLVQNFAFCDGRFSAVESFFNPELERAGMANDRSESYREERRRRRDEEPLDFSPSSTAVDPEHAAQDASEDVQTGRHAYTENATFTEERLDAPSANKSEAAPAVSEFTDSDEHEHSEWLSLNQANRTVYTDDEKNSTTEQRRQGFRDDTEAWGRRIGLTDHEIERAITIIERTEREWRENHGTETVILATLTLVANENDKAIRERQALSSKNPDMTETYEEIRENLDVMRHRVKSCRDHLRGLL